MTGTSRNRGGRVPKNIVICLDGTNNKIRRPPRSASVTPADPEHRGSAAAGLRSDVATVLAYATTAVAAVTSA
jgi:hypothetical protein